MRALDHVVVARQDQPRREEPLGLLLHLLELLEEQGRVGLLEVGGRSRYGAGCRGRRRARPAATVSERPDTDRTSGAGWDSYRSGRPWGVSRARRRPPSRARGPAPGRMSPG